ncbi:DUF4062 domain-containing protein [Candidatus Bathyarchaeota archaeon]|nr:DUF4062 domain-containing protein [Candidatus Bathyarchaeota archaeon]
MAIPKVFISSTCYDLRYIRENLKYFIKTVGYEPVLSEEGAIYFDPALSTQDSCLREVPSCQLFVLIIGGRFGEAYKDTEASITNIEYREAVKSKVPIFALVDSSVHSEYFVYQKNKANPGIDENKIIYPSVDSTKIFDFFEEVRRNSVNNALVPFSDFSDIEAYLRQQWAGMMFSFLTRQNEDRRVADTLSTLTQISKKVEFLSTQILKSIGTEEAKLTSELYDVMMSHSCIRDLTWFKLKPTPRDVLKHDTFKNCAASLGKKLKVVYEADFSLSGDNEIAADTLESDSEDYYKLREEMLKILLKYKISLEDFLK